MKTDLEVRWALCLVLLGGCGGNVRGGGEPGSGSGSGAGGSAGSGPTTASSVSSASTTGAGSEIGGPTTGVGGAGPVGPICTGVGRSEALWLTNPQYDNTIRDLLGLVTKPPVSVDSELPDDATDIGFRRDALGPQNPETSHRMAHYLNAQALVVARAKERLAEIVPCDHAMIGDDACADQFIASFGPRAYRRPLTADDAAFLRADYQTGRSTGTFEDGILRVIGSALLSPSFLQIEQEGPRGQTTTLDPYRIASRLSYFIYRSMPDGELFASAASGALASPEEIERQARRMLADPKAHQAMTQFFSEWLSLDALTGTPWSSNQGTNKSVTVTTEFPTLRGYMRTETERFAESVFYGDGRLSTLLTSTNTWLNEPLAALYGVGGITGLDFRPATVDPTTRAGILTHASILSTQATADRGSPTRRGAFVSRKLGCFDIPPPPAGLEPVQLPGPGTYRERLDRAIGASICAACHSYLEGIGYAFEAFDTIGRYQTMDAMQPIDSSARLPDVYGSAAGPFVGAVDFAHKLATSPEVRACVAKQWFRFALSRRETDDDACSIDGITRAFETSGDMRGLVVAVAKSPAFALARW